MQDMIKQIVDMDRKARQITEDARNQKMNSEKEVATKREEIRQNYLDRARKRIAQNEPIERSAAEKGWEEVKKRNAVVSNELDKIYSEKGDEWVKTIVARVIGE